MYALDNGQYQPSFGAGGQAQPMMPTDPKGKLHIDVIYQMVQPFKYKVMKVHK
jgi:hypothetical protein